MNGAITGKELAGMKSTHIEEYRAEKVKTNVRGYYGCRGGKTTWKSGMRLIRVWLSWTEGMPVA